MPAATRADVPARLARQTQELLDALASGDRESWARHFLDDGTWVADDGRVHGKAALIERLQPPPVGVTARCEVTDFRVVARRGTALATYVAHQDGTYFGQAVRNGWRGADVWVVVDGAWRLFASQTQALLTDPPALALAPATLREYEGVYELAPQVTYTVRRADQALAGTGADRPPDVLRAECADCFFVPGQPRVRKIFQRDDRGRVSALVDRREMCTIRWRRTAP